MEKVLEIKGLKKSFQNNFFSPRTEILKGLDFFVPKGSVTGFLGTNGSGKTTAFNCLLHLIQRDAGEIYFFGESDFNTHTKSRLGFLPEKPFFYEDLNLEELLLFYGRLGSSYKPAELKKKVSELIEKAGLEKSRSQRLETFSKGMLQRVGLIQCLVGYPDLLILDEPFSGLDMEGRHYAFSLIEELKQEGRSVFFSSHNLSDMERLCDRLVIIREGQIIFQGAIDDLVGQVGETRRIVFLEGGKKKMQRGLKPSEYQQRIEELIKGKCDILSVETEYQNLESVYTRVSQLKQEHLK